MWNEIVTDNFWKVFSDNKNFTTVFCLARQIRDWQNYLRSLRLTLILCIFTFVSFETPIRLGTYAFYCLSSLNTHNFWFNLIILVVCWVAKVQLLNWKFHLWAHFFFGRKISLFKKNGNADPEMNLSIVRLYRLDCLKRLQHHKSVTLVFNVLIVNGVSKFWP